MNIERLTTIKTIREFFGIKYGGEISEETALFLESMREVRIAPDEDIVTYGACCDDGMYIILEGSADVYNEKGELINTLSVGDFIGELGLINDDKRVATVRAKGDVLCANISKSLFFDIAAINRKVYGIFMNMLYNKTTKLVTESERIKSELAIAAQIQNSCLENDFSEFNALRDVDVTASMRTAKEVGGDFYDIFMIDDKRICFLVADVSGKGIPAALFMSIAKTNIRNYAMLGLPLSEAVAMANRQLCYKNETMMFVTMFICVLDIQTDVLTYVDAGHNMPYIGTDGEFYRIDIKPDIALGIISDAVYHEHCIELKKGSSVFLYTDGVTEALDNENEFFGEKRLDAALNRYADSYTDAGMLVDAVYSELKDFSEGRLQADDITMLFLSRK